MDLLREAVKKKSAKLRTLSNSTSFETCFKQNLFKTKPFFSLSIGDPDYDFVCHVLVSNCEESGSHVSDGIDQF